MAASACVSSRGQRGICFLPWYLGQTLVQTLHLAQHEYINAYGANSWRQTIRESHEQSANHISPDADADDDPSPTLEQEPAAPDPEPEPESAPAPTPAASSETPPPSERMNSSLTKASLKATYNAR